MKITNIFLFGDSITYGARDTEYGGWATQLRIYFDKKTGEGTGAKYYCYNLGISGEVTDELLERFVSEVCARIDSTEKNIILFAYGANDSAYLPKEDRFNVTLEKFQSNLEEAATQAKKFSSKIVFLNITPVVDSLTKNMEYRSRLNEYVDKYNLILKAVSAECGAVLIDLNSILKKYQFENLLSKDGLHPNTQGHKVIFEKVKEALETLI